MDVLDLIRALNENVRELIVGERWRGTWKGSMYVCCMSKNIVIKG